MHSPYKYFFVALLITPLLFSTESMAQSTVRCTDIGTKEIKEFASRTCPSGTMYFSNGDGSRREPTLGEKMKAIGGILSQSYESGRQGNSSQNNAPYLMQTENAHYRNSLGVMVYQWRCVYSNGAIRFTANTCSQTPNGL
jgi:hypothetical protein